MYYLEHVAIEPGHLRIGTRQVGSVATNIETRFRTISMQGRPGTVAY